jgi:hypothetical protein
VFADEGDFMEGEVQVEPPGFLERAGAAILNNMAKFLVEFLGIKDINTLVYQSDDRNLAGGGLVYNTFPASVWGAIDRFYDIFSGVAYYLLAIAIMAWALLALFRSGDYDGQLSLREMAVGILIYVIGMYLAGHLIRLFFLVNNFIIAWSVDVLRAFDYDPYTTGYIGEVIARITDSMEYNQTIGGAVLFLVIVFVVAVLNYQYVVRLLVMSIMIVLLPLVLFASIFPASRRAFDIWVREFAVQAWLPAAHAIAFSVFFAVMSNRDPSTVNFIMVIAMLIGLASVGPLMRMALGAPGGKVSGALGFGSVAAISMMLRSIRGGRAKATVSATPVAGAGMPNMNTNIAQGLGRGLALGAAASGLSGSSGVSVASGLAGTVTGRSPGDMLKNLGKSVVRQGVGMAAGLAAGVATTAMTGNMEAGVLGAMRGHQLGKSVADKTMNFASGLYSHLSPYQGVQAPYDILSPTGGKSPDGSQLPQSSAGVLPRGVSSVLPPGMSSVSRPPADANPEAGHGPTSGSIQAAPSGGIGKPVANLHGGAYVQRSDGGQESLVNRDGASDAARPLVNPPVSSPSVNVSDASPESGMTGTVAVQNPAPSPRSHTSPVQTPVTSTGSGEGRHDLKMPQPETKPPQPTNGSTVAMQQPFKIKPPSPMKKDGN